MEDNMQINNDPHDCKIDSNVSSTSSSEHLFRLDTNHNEIGHTIRNAYI